ncbi:Hcn1 [Symbiodinium natans]|uniref:Hcn1 protein n=1 Tax=Symbiodinium natans TaxID=878477 RepID=A0A812LEP5_9DINO|nr:Hcn1 [Symbiodinium natans]
MPSDPMPDSADGPEGTEASDEEFAEASPGLAGLERTMHSVAVFSECSYEFVEAIMLHVRKILLHSGKVLVTEDADAPKSMYVVLWGTLDVYRMDEKIGSVSNGQVLGEGLLVGIFDRSEYFSSLVAACLHFLPTGGLLRPVVAVHYRRTTLAFGKRTRGYMCEWTQQNEMRLALRRPVALRQVSEAGAASLVWLLSPGERLLLEEDALFLVLSCRWEQRISWPRLKQATRAFVEMAKDDDGYGLVRHLYFAGDVIHTEGQEDPPLAFLFDGDVSVEVVGRTVRREEASLGFKGFRVKGETTGRGSTVVTESEANASPAPPVRRSSLTGRKLSVARRPSVDEGGEQGCHDQDLPALSWALRSRCSFESMACHE